MAESTFNHFENYNNFQWQSSRPEDPYVIFVLGGPGSGKGTQSRQIGEEYGFYPISAGDCLREEMNDPESEYVSNIKDCIENGQIVPVDITVGLLRKKMEKLGWKNGRFLIDGFPRNVSNVEGWIRQFNGSVNVGFCLMLVCNEKEMEARILNRARESGRIDDNINSIQKRFQIFRNETEPVAEWFKTKGMCREIDACQPIHCVTEQITKLFDSLHIARLPIAPIS